MQIYGTIGNLLGFALRGCYCCAVYSECQLTNELETFTFWFAQIPSEFPVLWECVCESITIYSSAGIRLECLISVGKLKRTHGKVRHYDDNLVFSANAYGTRTLPNILLAFAGSLFSSRLKAKWWTNVWPNTNHNSKLSVVNGLDRSIGIHFLRQHVCVCLSRCGFFQSWFCARRIRPLTFPIQHVEVREKPVQTICTMSCISIREKKSTSKFILSCEKRNGKCVSSHHNHSVFTTACVLCVLYFMEKLVSIYFLIGFSLRFIPFYNCARRRRQSQFLNASNTIRTVWRRLSDRSIKRFKCPRSERWFWTNKLH